MPREQSEKKYPTDTHTLKFSLASHQQHTSKALKGTTQMVKLSKNLRVATAICQLLGLLHCSFPRFSKMAACVETSHRSERRKKIE